MITLVPPRHISRHARRLVSLSLLAGLALAATLPQCFADPSARTAATRPAGI
jgi:hypothetical protein